jgi:hypothetical protein
LPTLPDGAEFSGGGSARFGGPKAADLFFSNRVNTY